MAAYTAKQQQQEQHTNDETTTRRNTTCRLENVMSSYLIPSIVLSSNSNSQFSIIMQYIKYSVGKSINENFNNINCRSYSTVDHFNQCIVRYTIDEYSLLELYNQCSTFRFDLSVMKMILNME